MKKILSMILALAMILSLGVTAFAEDLGTDEYNGNLEGSVTATYTAGSEAKNAGAIYYVKLTWTDVTVAYTGGNGGTYTWDPQNLVYTLTDNTDGQWTDSGIEIEIENRSNASITATANYVKTVDAVNLTFDNEGKVDLGSAAIDTANENAEIAYTDTNTTGKEQTAKITGTVTGDITAGGTLGTITITLTHD